MTSTTWTGNGSTHVYFRHDPRILPGLGQQPLCGMALESDKILLYGASKEISEHMKLFADLVSKGPNYSQFQIFEDSKITNRRELITELISIFHTFNYSVYYSSITISSSSLILFKPSNIKIERMLGLGLSNGNVLSLFGGGQEEIEVIRETLISRWPYPIVSDGAISNGEGWRWKVKRYPWRMSYGSKVVDRAVDRASRLVKQISIPPPANSDLESAKSVVVFIIKELAEKGWKFLGSNVMNSGDKSSGCLLIFSS